MTGTGTQADPYIVDTWDDFVTAVGELDTYVKVVDNTVWDMNDILLSGLTNQIEIKCNEIEGNFAEIRNIRVSAQNIFFFYKATTVKHLNLLNITDTTYNSNRAWFDTSTSNPGTVSFENCTITGLITSGIFSDANDFLSLRFTNDENKGCSINLKFGGDAKLSGSYVMFYNSLIELGGKSSASNLYFSNFNNCYIQGECPWTRIIITTTGTNIFDLKVKELSGADSGNHKLNIVNSNKVGAIYSTFNMPTLVTEAQLHDAEYLKSVGFPIL